MYVSTIADLTRIQAKLTPNRTALVFQERRTSFAELDRRANQVARGLLAAGISNKERVAVLDNNTDHFYEICIGAARANSVVVPLNPPLCIQDLLQVMMDCRPRALFVGSEYIPLIDQLGLELFFLDFILETGAPYIQWRSEQSWREPGLAICETGIALQLYTAGAQKVSRGVMLSHESIFHHLKTAGGQGSADPVAGMSVHDIVLICLPNAHAGGSVYGLQALARGARLVVGHELVTDEIAALIDQERVTRSLMMPVMIPYLITGIRNGTGRCETLRSLLYVAVPMPPVLLLSALYALEKATFGKLYGLTESCGPISYLDEDDHRAIAAGDLALARSCGRPIAGVDVRIVDEKGRPLAVGEVGEVICRTAQVMKGYWGRNEETNSVLQDGWLHTGDVGYMDEQGYLFIDKRGQVTPPLSGEYVQPTRQV